MRAAAVVVLACCATSHAGDADPVAERMRAEGLLETSPAGLGAANYLLSKSLKRGADDMGAYTYLAKLLIQHALALAETNEAERDRYRARAVPMLYNLAANTWVGWGGVGDVQDHHRRLGLEAARLNVKLAADLALAPERRANGYWILGAHLIAARDYEGAIDAFNRSHALATEGGRPTEALMAEGWANATEIIRGRDATSALDAVKARLISSGKDGRFYAEQYQPAIDVFRSPGAPSP